jgi:membrane complex biogenesis BtpA family protein
LSIERVLGNFAENKFTETSRKMETTNHSFLRFQKLFRNKKPIIGMIHVRALPGTPAYTGDVKAIIKKALDEAKVYKNLGVEALMIENMHDTPYLNRKVGHEISSVMSIIAYEIKKLDDTPLGIQLLAGANKAALAAAGASGADFIRAEGFVFAHTADEGIMNSDAGKLLRYRKQIDAEKVLIFTDIKKKHSSHALTSDVDIVSTAHAAEFFLSDGLIITGESTGKAADFEELEKVKASTSTPVLIGSGITDENVRQFYDTADGLIIGSYFKKSGFWKNDLDEDRIKTILKKI